ncbi:MAG: SDR family oxidoreductase [Chloroflexi bacterium]|nr:SDR family oxidoreductase [Chloroflexota bacterium]
MKLDGKVAIVTGGGRGIGRTIALAYAREGAAVVLAARTVAEIDSVAGEIKALGRKPLPISTDVTKEDEVQRMAEQTIKTFGKVDVLVCDAGGTLGTRGKALWELDPKAFQAVLDVNITGAFLCARVVAPQMIKQGSGSIINITSAMGRQGKASFGAYSTAKFGEEGLTQVLAAELAPYNVRANALDPGGPIATGTALTNPKIDYSITARPDVVCPLAVYLASDESKGVTGKSLNCQEWNPAHGFGDLSQYLYKPHAA